MPQLELYENKVISDREFPVQLQVDRMESKEIIFSSHWHEQLEMHFLVTGAADFYQGQQRFKAKAGDLVIANTNELHSAWCTECPYRSYVIMFNIENLSEELAKNNYIFSPLICADEKIASYVMSLFDESRKKQLGYRQNCRGITSQLLVYLCRNYALDALPERDSIRRKKDLERLNVVISYLENHFQDLISVRQMAEMVCLSEDRFGHLFREEIGKSPLQYLNNVRLHKALILLKTNEYTITEVADAVGFRDYNHFSRLFRKRYGCSPIDVKRNKINPLD